MGEFSNMNAIINLRNATFMLLYFLAAGIAVGQDSGNVIPFQGQLANQTGVPLSLTNVTTLVFRLYRVPVAGVAIWEESQPALSVNAGRFSVLLGSRTELPANTNFNSTLYLGITVDDGNPATADVEMRPRQALVPVISAKYAQNSDKLHGYDWSALFGTNDPTAGTLLDSKIRDGSINAAKLQPGTITSNQIANQTITASQIGPGTITSNLLAAQIIDALVPVGTVVSFASSNAPASGWLQCDGSAVSRSQYSRLFNAIGVTWGVGDGTTTFNLPDLRGRGPIGAGQSSKSDIAGRSLSNRTIANYGGEEIHLLSKDEMPSHSHDIGRGDRTAPDSIHGFGSNVRSDYGIAKDAALPTGGGQAHNIMAPFAVLNFIIKY